MIFDVLRWFQPVLHPINLLWFGCLVAAPILYWKRRKTACLLLLGIAFFITVVGSELPFGLLARLERPYIRPEGLEGVPQADAVLMLGGGHEFSRNDPLGFNLNGACDRTFCALELVRRGKASRLILAGGASTYFLGENREAMALQDWLRQFLPEGTEIQVLGNSAHTRDEAVQCARLVQENEWQRILLVTSASHMRRAEAVFLKAGVPVEPVACDFYKLGTPRVHWKLEVFPWPAGFSFMNLWIHEQVGWWMYRLKGWV